MVATKSITLTEELRKSHLFGQHRNLQIICLIYYLSYISTSNKYQIKYLPDKYFNGEPCIADVLNVDEGDVRVGGVLVQGPDTRVTISDQ